MINTIKLKCPSCEANLEIDANRETCFCQYCGTKILISDDNRKTININKNVTYTNVDEAAKLRAENERLKLQNQIYNDQRKINREEKLDSAKRGAAKRLVIVGLVLFILAFVIKALPIEIESIKELVPLFGMLGLLLVSTGGLLFLTLFSK